MIKRPKLSLVGSSFSSNPDDKFQANFILFGPTGARKSSTIFTYCPEPILTLNFDSRDAAPFQRAQETCSICKLIKDDHENQDPNHPFSPIQIFRTSLRMPVGVSEKINRTTDLKQARIIGQKYLDAFWKEYNWAVEHSMKGEIGTICIDTFEELKPIICAAVYGRTEIGFQQYKAQARLNGVCRDIVNKAKEGSAHLAIIARESEIYINEKGIGRFRPRVPKPLLEAVNWSAYIDFKSNGGIQTNEIEITMGKCGGNAAEVGAKYTERGDRQGNGAWQEDGPFAYICWNQWSRSELEDWK